MTATTRWVGLAAAILVFAIATLTTADPDLWGHLRFGLDTVHTRSVGSVYPYAFTQDRPWVNHEWLGEVPMALAYLGAGIAGLALLKGALVSGSLFLVWFALRGSDPIARMVTMAAVVIGTGSITRTLRPQLWSLLFLAILCHTLAGDRPRRRRWLPVLFAAWANLHGGWIVGLGTLGLWAAGDVWIHRERFVEWAVIVLACIAATLVNPHGLGLWRFLLETVHLTRDITEWQPLWTLAPISWLPWIAAAVVGILAARSPGQHRLQTAAVLTMLAYSSLRVSRIEPLFVEATAILLAPWICGMWPAGHAPRSPFSVRQERMAADVLVIALVGAAGWVASASLRCIDVVGPWVPEPDVVRLLETAPAGRLVTMFDWGEYHDWHLGPRILVSMDGEREAVYSDSRVAEHDAILAGNAAGLRTLESWQPEYVWLPARSTATKEWLAAHGYRIERDAPDSFLAVRADVPSIAVTSQPLRSRRCFPD